MTTIVILFDPETSQINPFSLHADLEVVLELLNGLQARGEKITSAYLWDQNQRLSLPLEAFDGQPMELALQALKQQWEQVLSQPVASQPVEPSFREELLQKRLVYYQTRAHSFQQSNDALRELRQGVLDWFPRGQRKTKLLSRYERLITDNEARLDDLYHQCRCLQNQLSQ